MTTYKVKYMHGDADAYTNETFKIEEEYKNKLLKEILEIFKHSRPEWRDNFLNIIDESIIEEYLIENYDEEEDSPELWKEIEEILRKERANKFLNIVKEAYSKNLILNKYEKAEVEKVLTFENSIEKKEFYKELFDLVWNISDIKEILIPDITCEDRFAKIEKIQIKEK